MGVYKPPQVVKLFIGAITRFIDFADFIEKLFTERFGEIDVKLGPIEFNFTTYYIPQQGQPLYRLFYSFKKLIPQLSLIKIKRWTNFVEEKLKGLKDWGVQRPFNFDPGFVSLSNVVLATTKPYSHRIYLGNFIYAEVTLIYRKNSFVPLEWTYPDYTTKEYIDFFNKIRVILKRERYNYE